MNTSTKLNLYEQLSETLSEEIAWAMDKFKPDGLLAAHALCMSKDTFDRLVAYTDFPLKKNKTTIEIHQNKTPISIEVLGWIEFGKVCFWIHIMTEPNYKKIDIPEFGIVLCREIRNWDN